MKADSDATSIPHQASLIIKAQTDSIVRFGEFVVACATAARFPLARMRQLELVVEEVLMNICRHAYGDTPGEVEIRCIRVAREHLCVELLIVESHLISWLHHLPISRQTWRSGKWVVWESRSSAR